MAAFVRSAPLFLAPDEGLAGEPLVNRAEGNEGNYAAPNEEHEGIAILDTVNEIEDVGVAVTEQRNESGHGRGLPMPSFGRTGGLLEVRRSA